MHVTSVAKSPKSHACLMCRCNIRDILDTCFEGWDNSPATCQPSAPDCAGTVTTTSHAVRVTHPEGDSAPAGLRQSHTPVRPPWRAHAKQNGKHLSSAASLMSLNSKRHAQGSSSVASTKSLQDEEEAKRAMPPPQRSCATAESVQAAVAAAQKEEWATAAHAAAWGKSFVEPLAQMGAAAWNTAFPRQVNRSSQLLSLLSTALHCSCDSLLLLAQRPKGPKLKHTLLLLVLLCDTAHSCPLL